MKAIITVFLLVALFSGVCGKHGKRDLANNTLVSLSADSLNNSNNLNSAENVEYINSMEIFKAKVAERLSKSIVLTNQPEMKTQLMGIAVAKFKLCETPSDPEEVANHKNHSCLGIATGQMMSLIRECEKNQSTPLENL